MYYFTRFNFSPVIPLLRADLGISNAQAGGLMAFFFVTYTLFQLPAGYLGDRLGPRRILTFGAIVSIIGNLMFSQGSSYVVLAIAQLVNGMGQAMGWSSAVKLIVSWYPRSRRGTAIGFFATCVTGGSSVGIRLSGFLGDHQGWRSSFIIPALMMAAVALVFWILVRDHPREKGLPDFEDEVDLEKQLDSDTRSRLAVVMTNRTLWTVALVYFCFVYVQFGCLVWIPAFLNEAYSMSVDRASTFTFFILLPGVAASPLGGYLSDRFFGGRRKPLIILGMAVLSGSYCRGCCHTGSCGADDPDAGCSFSGLSIRHPLEKIVGHRHGVSGDIYEYIRYHHHAGFRKDCRHLSAWCCVFLIWSCGVCGYGFDFLHK
jgi:sugar phosphate permease